MICVSLGNTSLQEALQICNEVKIVEIRADLLMWSLDDYEKIFSTGVKSVFTCRPGSLSDKERLELFNFAAKSGAAFIDIELESDLEFRDNVLEIVQKYQTELIVSYHNFESTPDKNDLEEILDSCYLKSADVAKIACRVYTPSDVARLLSLYEKTGRKIIIGIGNIGKISRIAAGFLGGEFSYASSSVEGKTAEGQIFYKTMYKISELLKS